MVTLVPLANEFRGISISQTTRSTAFWENARESFTLSFRRFGPPKDKQKRRSLVAQFALREKSGQNNFKIVALRS